MAAVSRRRFLLRTLGVIAAPAALGLLAACGQESPATQTTPTTAPAVATQPPTQSPSPTAGTPTERPTASPSPATLNWQEVERLAREEGELTLYDGHGGAVPTIAFAAQEFEKEYGIRVNVSVMRASEAQERVRVEHESGSMVVDVQTVGAGNVYDEEPWGVLETTDGLPNLARVPEEFLQTLDALGPQFRNHAVWEAVGLYGILVNTRLVSPDLEPKSWRDIVDERWRGQLIIDDPRALGGGNYFFVVSYKRFGREFQERLASLQPVLTRNIAEATNRVARGEFAMMVPFVFGLFPQIKDLPTVKIVVPQEGAMFSHYGVAIIKNSPHPNAARVFANFLLSDKVQRNLAENYLRPVVPQAIEAAPEDVRALLASPLWGTHDEPHRRQEYLQLATEIYGQ